MVSVPSGLGGAPRPGMRRGRARLRRVAKGGSVGRSRTGRTAAFQLLEADIRCRPASSPAAPAIARVGGEHFHLAGEVAHLRGQLTDLPAAGVPRQPGQDVGWTPGGAAAETPGGRVRARRYRKPGGDRHRPAQIIVSSSASACLLACPLPEYRQARGGVPPGSPSIAQPSSAKIGRGSAVRRRHGAGTAPPATAADQVPALLSTVTARRFCDQQEMSLHTATGRSLP